MQSSNIQQNPICEAFNNFLFPTEFQDKKSVKKIISYLKENDKAICKEVKTNSQLAEKLKELKQRFMTEAKFDKKNPESMESLLKLDCLNPHFSAAERIELALKCPNLRVLDLHNTDLTDEQLAFVAEKFPQLEILNIRKCNKLTLEGFKQLANFTQLKKVWMSECKGISNEALEYLPASLEKLFLRNNRERISFEGMKILGTKGSLKKLVVRGCEITDSCLPLLSSLENLRMLDLHRCREISDEALKVIADSFPKLRALNLRECAKVTEGGLRPILELLLQKVNPSAKKPPYINVQGCKNISEALLNDLKEKGLKVKS